MKLLTVRTTEEKKKRIRAVDAKRIEKKKNYVVEAAHTHSHMPVSTKTNDARAHIVTDVTSCPLFHALDNSAPSARRRRRIFYSAFFNISLGFVRVRVRDRGVRVPFEHIDVCENYFF